MTAANSPAATAALMWTARGRIGAGQAVLATRSVSARVLFYLPTIGKVCRRARWPRPATERLRAPLVQALGKFEISPLIASAGILRAKLNIKWEKDRGKEPVRDKQELPWFWGWDEEKQDFASGGWRVDAAALATMAACGTPEQHGAVLGTVRAVYLPWLENTARQLQQLIRENGQSVSKRTKPIATVAGRLVLFADGLRMDVAQQLAEKLAAVGIECTQDWEWSTIPSVTATAKLAASPIADAVAGGEAGDEFSTRLVSTGQLWTQDRFVTALKERGWQFLGSEETGDPSGSA